MHWVVSCACQISRAHATLSCEHGKLSRALEKVLRAHRIVSRAHQIVFRAHHKLCLCVFSVVYLLYFATPLRLDWCLDAIGQQQLCLFGESQTGCVMNITFWHLHPNDDCQLKNFLVISEPVWWIKANMEVMWLILPFLWQVVGLGSIRLRRDSLWTHVGGRWCPAVLWHSVAWCSNTENKKKNEIWLLQLVGMFSEANMEERGKLSVVSCASTQANQSSNPERGDRWSCSRQISIISVAGNWMCSVRDNFLVYYSLDLVFIGLAIVSISYCPQQSNCRDIAKTKSESDGPRNLIAQMISDDQRQQS